MNLIALATPFFILAVVLEIALGRLGKAKAHYEGRDTLISLSMGLGSQIAGLLTAALIFATTVWVYQHRIFTIPVNAIWAWAAIFFLEDLAYYWFHRLSHERRVWWAAHVNHHSSQHYNLSTALRQTWTGGLNGSWIVWLPLAFVGFPPVMIAAEKSVSLIYQFWIHTEMVGKLPKPIEAVFNTPSHHRVHHARNPRYLDRNYAGILIIWDRLFGTFVEETDEEARYGIVKNLGDFNLLRAAFHEWEAIGRDLIGARSAREVVGYLLGPPGWSPDGTRQTSAMIRAEWLARGSNVSAHPGEGRDPAVTASVSPRTAATGSNAHTLPSGSRPSPG